jgi:two-component system OmpR family response regulator|tara:strand:+ start:22004 stop:22378 length:375 start_codon:yes stop_codon:yes gene_type:complete
MKIVTPKKIFIVDDDEMLTMALSDYLTREVKHEIHVFHAGEEVIKHISENPDIVILDFYLNTVNENAADGLEILEAIRKHLPKTRFIMLSSQESYLKAARTIQEGAEQYVIKGEDAFEKIAGLI